MDAGNRKLNRSHAGGPSKGAVLFVMLLAAVMILAIAAFRVAADSGKPQSSYGKVTPAPTPSYGAVSREGERITAILERVDAETKTIQIYSVDEKEVLWLTYTSATNIVDKYGKAIVAGQLSPGDILTVEYEREGNSARFVAISEEIWEHPYQTGLTVSDEREMVTVGERNFMYSDALHVYNGTNEEELSYILGQDSVTLRGIGSEVYVIIVERGHGYLSLKEGQDYVGGSILVNNQYVTQITKDMLLTLKEGKCEVTVENDGLKATLETTIMRDQTTVLDLTEYVRVPDPVGQVTFRIQPAGALLFINDQNTYYGEPVELDYGVYSIRVESGGYVSYSGTLRVDSAAPEFAVSLPEAPVEDTGLSDGSGGSSMDGSGTGADSNNPSGSGSSLIGGDSPDNSSEGTGNADGSYRTDDEHYIIIYSDDEVEVYLDGDYMGVTEEGKAEFEKFIGTFELELVRGEETKSYVIQVDDDGEDFIFRRYFED
ncbi:MAG: hypothetical protein K2N63_05785 [Lachnospiraceae bacterium]|nr:hypothetical protein [Lachnospiraceae bacterium]